MSSGKTSNKASFGDSDLQWERLAVGEACSGRGLQWERHAVGDRLWERLAVEDKLGLAGLSVGVDSGLNFSCVSSQNS